MGKQIITEESNIDVLVRHKNGYTKLNVYEFLKMSSDEAKSILETVIGSNNLTEGNFDTLLMNIHECFTLEQPKTKKGK